MAVFRLLLLFALSALAFDVTLDRVRYPTGATLSYAEHPDYPQWSASLVPHWDRIQTYIATPWEPLPAAVSTVVLIISGQQNYELGPASCGTGQCVTYKANWTSGRNRVVPLYDVSAGASIMRGDIPGLTSSNTFLGLVFDAHFNWELPALEKLKIVNAFSSWLKSKAGSNLERVVLMGASRGGALSMRLAKSLRQSGGLWGTVPIYVGLVDAVPNSLELELLTNALYTCDNPLTDDDKYHSEKANLASFFSGIEVLPQIRHVVSGWPAQWDTLVHSFCSDATEWYNQTWVALEHGWLARCTDQGNSSTFEPQYWDAGFGVVYHWVRDMIVSEH